MLRPLAAALLALCAASPAHAYLKAGPAGYGHWLKAATVQDGMATSLAAAYSFRRVRSAYAGPAVKLRRTTGGTQDINFTAAGDFDTAAATTFCAATTCFLDTWYDQSGLARHAVQTNPAAQPSFTFNCTGTLPCATSTTGQFMQAPDVTPAAGPASFSTVQKVAGAGGLCYGLQAAAQLLGINGANMVLYNGAAISQAVSAGAWHVSEGVINSAASVLALDGVEVAGTIAPVTTLGPIYTAYNGGPPACNYTESVWWNNYALTPAERTALAQNQQQYWAPLPLDTFATPAAAYSMRRLKSSYAGPAIRLRRASDNAEQDINFLGFTGFTGAPIDTAAANAHCAATSCTVATWYDQSGNVRNATQATAADQPAYIANCNGGLPCARSPLGSSAYLIVTGITAASPLSLNAVAKQTARSSTGCREVWYGNSNELNQQATLDLVFLSNGAATVQAASAGLAWHSHTGVMNGAASVVNVDGAETTGTVTPNLTAGNIVVDFNGGVGATCDVSEALAWSGYALTQPERAALTANQRGFWGF